MRQHLAEIGRVAGLLLVAGLIAMLVTKGRQFGCTSVPQDYHRMEPALKPGDRFAIRRDVETLESVPTGSLIVFRLDGGARQEALVGRVVARAGQIVSVKRGRYYVDGKPISTKAKAGALVEAEDLLVPRDCVLVGFDANNNAPLAECILPLRNIIGKAKK